MKYAIVFSFLLCHYASIAQSYRALLIGIDKYAQSAGTEISNESERTSWPDLEGSKNDARAMKSLLQLRYGFKNGDIIELYDNQATRNAILKSLNLLLSNSKQGDIAFIYYAGHGSQQKNSKSIEADKKDESIVPSDAWRKGVADIRDKEQARIYNAFLDKGVKLTVIMDCCHSGSMSRGAIFYQLPKYRYIAVNKYDANDASNPVAPEVREGDNFLMISASQDNEMAEEQQDDYKIPHGAFTLALMQAINQQPIDASVYNLLTSIRAILKSNGKKQEPQLAGSLPRSKQTLLGITKGTLSDKLLVPATKISNGNVEFLAGFALGLNKGNELTMLNDPSVVIQIDSVTGISRSLGKIIKGKLMSVRAGSLFEVTNWVSPPGAMLKIFIPPTEFQYTDIIRLATWCKQIKSSVTVQWVTDLEKSEPDISLWYNMDSLNANIDGRLQRNIKAETANEIINIAQGKSLFFNLPSDVNLAGTLMKKFRANKNISVVNDALEASYILYGTINEDGLPSYGLIRSQLSLKDTLESMPLQTGNFALKTASEEARNEVADSIYEYVGRLAKIRGWLNLAGPKSNNFPFHLAIFNINTKQEIEAKGYKVGDIVGLHLLANPNHTQISIPVKYVYVFAIDSDGRMQLIFPNNNEDNRIPAYAGDKMVTDKLIYRYEVGDPVGTDNIFLLATDERLMNAAAIFQQDGIKRRAPANAGPIETLLNAGNEGSRGFGRTPANWSLLRLAVKASR